MKIVIFGLSISSSWGNGHATIWRGLISALTRMDHQVVFFEKDVDYYAGNRDFEKYKGLTLILYEKWEWIRRDAEENVRGADVSIVTSYCPDAIEACEVLNCGDGLKVFYDLDTPVTFRIIESGKWPFYVPRKGLGQFDLVLSYTGGGAVKKMKEILGARVAFQLYGSADPQFHFPTCRMDKYFSDLSYLGTYAEDRQGKLEELFFKPATILKKNKFLLAGAQYPVSVKLSRNVAYYPHVAPPEHSCFYCSSSFTLNVTRGAMADMGYCASGRLFEAALCEVPIISDSWIGIETFFNPGEEIILVESAKDVIVALKMSQKERQELAKAARRRVLREHTSEKRAQELIAIIKGV